MTPTFRAERTRTRELLRLAWPAAMSYVLNNAYRINDQFWIQGLGEKAQTAVGASFFVVVLNFALVFLAMGGTLALVSRSVGAKDTAKRDTLIRHALVFGVAIGMLLSAMVVPLVGRITSAVGLEGEAASLSEEYLFWLYSFMPAIALFPVVDSIFVGLGNTRIPMGLQACAVAMNYVLNPLLIYGEHAGEAVDAPGAELVASIAGALGVEGMGIGGAAIATGIARTAVVLGGVVILRSYTKVSLLPTVRVSLRASWERIASIVRISAPSSVSIAVYALAYIGLLRYVLTPLGDEVTAGLGIGFQVFEGISFPFYLGVSIAGSTLVGREIGARNPEGVMQFVGSARLVARFCGVAFALAFWFLGPLVVERFTQDASVARETLVYVQVLAYSQYWVAVESVNEKVLLGAGQTGPILWIAPLGNLLRIPIAWLLVFGASGIGLAGLGAAGVWWAINATTCLKAFLFWVRVQRGAWLKRALAS